MNPLRYSLNIRADPVVPGVKLKYGKVGPPRNMRRILRGAPPLVQSDPPWTRKLPELKPWVVEHLTPYQKAGWAFADILPGANLWWAPGSGKTWGAICWDVGRSQKSVVVTRAFTKNQWKREYEALTNIHPLVLDGETATEIPKDTRTVILNWEILPHWVSEIKRWKGAAYLNVIFDEIHKGKNHKRTEKYLDDNGDVKRRDLNNVSAAAASLARVAQRRLGLTATSMPNGIDDLWSQLDLIEPDCWGNNWEFVHRYCAAKPGKYGGLDTSGRSNVEELRARLTEVSHVVKYEEMARSLPPKRRQLCYLDPSEQTSPAAFAADLKRAAKYGAEALFEMRLMEAASRKRRWILEVVREAIAGGQKVNVMTGRRRECEDLIEMLSKLDAPVWGGHGEQPVEARVAAVASYKNHAGAAVFVGTTEAFGEAIDGLQCTDLAIVAFIPYTQGKLVQQEGRWTRHGQRGPVLIMYPIALGTVDEDVADLVLQKVENVYAVLGDNNDKELAAALAGQENEEDIIAKLIKKMLEESNAEE